MSDIERNEPEKLMDAKAVATLLGLHIATVREMAKAGELLAFKIGSDWRFRPSDVKAWQDAQVRRPAPEEISA